MDVTKFWNRVATGDDCWEWTGARSTTGYGVFIERGRQVKAHRRAWELTNGGAVPDGLNVLHSCDNRVCCRPAHLRVGSVRDNHDDMWSRGRGRPESKGRPQAGALNHNARVTAEDVAHIRGMAAAGRYQDEIAAEFGIDQGNVSHIVRGKTWVNVEPVAYPPFPRTRPVGRNARIKKRLTASGLAATRAARGWRCWRA